MIKASSLTIRLSTIPMNDTKEIRIAKLLNDDKGVNFLSV